MVLVTINGEEKLLNWGATVRSALDAGGLREFNTILPQLSVLKPYGPGKAAVEFNHSDSTILNLILMGGETISWK